MLRLLAALAIVSAVAPAWAQRREAAATLPTAEAKLASPVQFGAITVPARSYRVSLTPEGFSFIDQASLVSLATVPAALAETAEKVPAAKLEVIEKGTEVRFVMHYESRIYTAIGKKLASPTDASSPVAYEDLETKALPPASDPTTPLAIVEASLPRLETSIISQCADRAQKAHWETDNPQFDKCVCPQIAKWRVPKVTEELRVQRPLSKGRNGYSFTADKDGHTKNCRVWSGSSAPADDTVAWKPASARKSAPPSVKTTKSITPTDTTSAEKKHP